MTPHRLAFAAVFAATGLFVACEELPADSEPTEAPAPEPQEAVPQVAPLTPPQLEGMGLWGLGIQGQPRLDEQPIAAEVEEAPEKVAWTLSETALRHYIDWQKHLQDAQMLAEVAERIVSGDGYAESLRERARDFVEAESPEHSFARFGLSREEVQHAEQLGMEFASLREPGTGLDDLADLRGRAGGAERQFLAAVQDQQERSLREAAGALRAQYGDANVDLLLKYQASMPAFPKILEETVEVDAAAPEENVEAPPTEPSGPEPTSGEQP